MDLEHIIHSKAFEAFVFRIGANETVDVIVDANSFRIISAVWFSKGGGLRTGRSNGAFVHVNYLFE